MIKDTVKKLLNNEKLNEKEKDQLNNMIEVFSQLDIYCKTNNLCEEKVITTILSNINAGVLENDKKEELRKYYMNVNKLYSASLYIKNSYFLIEILSSRNIKHSEYYKSILSHNKPYFDNLLKNHYKNIREMKNKYKVNCVDDILKLSDEVCMHSFFKLININFEKTKEIISKIIKDKTKSMEQLITKLSYNEKLLNELNIDTNLIEKNNYYSFTINDIFTGSNYFNVKMEHKIMNDKKINLLMLLCHLGEYNLINRISKITDVNIVDNDNKKAIDYLLENKYQLDFNNELFEKTIAYLSSDKRYTPPRSILNGLKKR